jgi:hypothetical protein
MSLLTYRVNVELTFNGDVVIGTPLVIVPRPSIRPRPWNTAIRIARSPRLMLPLAVVKLSMAGGAKTVTLQDCFALSPQKLAGVLISKGTFRFMSFADGVQ